MKVIFKLLTCIFRLNFYRSYLNKTSPLFELEKLIKNLNNIKTIVDIGSNKGQFSVLARSYFPNAKIYSFEPQKHTLSTQKKIFLYDKHIKFFQIGLGNEKCNKKFYITNREDSSSFLEPEKTTNTYGVNHFQNIKINKLENIISLNQLKEKVLIKLDVQGFELEVLKGAKKLLKNVDYIITEFSYQKIYKKQVIANSLSLFLKKNNFVKMKTVNITKLNNKIFQSDSLFRKKRK